MQSGHPITKQQKLTNTFNSTTILCPSPFEGGDGGGLTTMAKVDYAYPVEALHGKVKKTHTVGFALRKETGCKFTQTFTTRTAAPTEAQTEVQTEVQKKFAAAVKAARVRMADASKQAQDLAAFRKQSKYKTLYGYVFSQVYAA